MPILVDFAFLFLLNLTGSGEPPIVIRHDVPDSAYIAHGRRFADVLAHVEERAEGTVLAPRWVLTAAHVVEPIGPFDDPYVMIHGVRYGVEKIIIHPEWEGGWDDILSNHDIALLKLDRPVPRVRPVALYRSRDELGQVVTLIGRGKTGTGLTGATGEKGHVVRGATNRVDGASPSVLILAFDEDETELEGLSGPGDSGNPALLERGDTLYVVGVGSAGTGRSAYGSIDLFVRVSSFADWIEQTMATDPPATADWSEPSVLDENLLWPATPVGSMARDFFAAYDASVRMQAPDPWVRFYASHDNRDAQRTVEEKARRLWQALVKPLGHLELQAYATAGPHKIMVLVHAPEENVWRSIGLDTSAESPFLLERLYMKVESAEDSLMTR